MKKLYLLAAAIMTTTAMFAQDSFPYWYISGEFNAYAAPGQDEWALMDDDEGEYGEFTGTFTVPAGEFKFNLVNPDGNFFVPVNPKNFDTHNETVTFTDNVFDGTSALAWEEYEENFYWVDPTWNGGMITVTVYATTNNPKIRIYAFPEGGNVDSDYNKDYSITPIDENQVISIYWNGAIDDIWYESGQAYIQASDGTQIDIIKNIPGQAGQVTLLDAAPFGLSIDLSSLSLPTGAYTLVIPAKYVQIVSNDWEDFLYNPEISYNFELKDAGVDSILTGNAAADIFNLQGLKVYNDVNSLPKGIYIINGKKFVVR